MTVTRFQMYS